MTLMDELKIMNFSIIDCLKTKGLSTKKNELITEILKDDLCFFKMSKKEAFVIFKNLDISDDMMEETYTNLTDKKEFYRLYNEGKININDKDLKIKYEIYNNNLFESEKSDVKKEEKTIVNVKKEKWYNKLMEFLKKIVS